MLFFETDINFSPMRSESQSNILKYPSLLGKFNLLLLRVDNVTLFNITWRDLILFISDILKSVTLKLFIDKLISLSIPFEKLSDYQKNQIIGLIKDNDEQFKLKISNKTF